MLKKKFTKLVSLRYDTFQEYCNSGQIIAQEARLIPLLKTGDEGALTSIFLSAVRLIDEFRESILKELKVGKSGRKYFLTEVVFKDIDPKSRIDGLIIVVSKGVITDAVVFEMKNKSNNVDKNQVEKYINLCKSIGVNKMVTVSNEFVADHTQSPVSVKVPKNFNLFHFSWTYLMTLGQLLLFKNDDNIKDEDQVELMREVLHYIEAPGSGVCGYHMMKPGWKETVTKITNRIPLKSSDSDVIDTVESWREEEKDIALLLSRKLGILVKSTPSSKTSLKDDISRIIDKQELQGNLSIKNSVSDIRIQLDFEVKTVSMAVKVVPPLDKGTKGRITWMSKQLEGIKKKDGEAFSKIEKDLMIEANIKHARQHIRVPLDRFDEIVTEINGREIQAFNIVLLCRFGAGFSSNKKFIVLIEQMVLDYYAGIVQYLTNWSRPAPKL